MELSPFYLSLIVYTITNGASWCKTQFIIFYKVRHNLIFSFSISKKDCILQSLLQCVVAPYSVFLVTSCNALSTMLLLNCGMPWFCLVCWCIAPHGLLQSVIFCGQFNTCLPFSLPAPAFSLNPTLPLYLLGTNRAILGYGRAGNVFNATHRTVFSGQRCPPLRRCDM